jgi:uncharacterized protein YbjT (DUF2867 family)
MAAPTDRTRTVLVAGATGLVGGCVLARLAERGHRTVAVGRRASGVADQDLVVDFADLPALPAADAAVCALGTTIAAAGSRAAFRAVDHDAVVAFARAARAAGARHCILVTAVGADPDAGVFYSRVKGEAERDVEAVGFEGLDLVRPGLLLGERTESRPVEALMQRLSPILNPLLVGGLDRYGAIDADTVAAAIAALVDRGPDAFHTHENRALRAHAGTA